jgi:SAM-dependent methyltransferase
MVLLLLLLLSSSSARADECTDGMAAFNLPRRVAMTHQPDLLSLASRMLIQPLAEWHNALVRGGIRSSDPHSLAGSYTMSARQFWWLNSRNEWFIWRQVPAVLNGRLPDRPLKVVDLGCGNGSSTNVLSRFLPKGSEILGLDLVPELINQAKAQRDKKKFTHHSGSVVYPEFTTGSVTETWRNEKGAPIPDRSVDFITSYGIVGHHLNEKLLDELASQADRVLAPDGIIALDPGPALSEAAIVQVMEARGFRKTERVYGHWLDLRGQVLFQRAP